MDGVIAGAFLTCVVGGFLPWVNTEVVVTGAALVVAPPEIAVLVLAAATGQMLAKTSVYTLARWAPERLPRKARDFLSSPRALSGNRAGTILALLASSSVGLPPFYLTTLAAGTLRVPLMVFAGAGLAGTALRYTALALGATLVAAGVEGGL